MNSIKVLSDRLASRTRPLVSVQNTIDLQLALQILSLEECPTVSNIVGKKKTFGKFAIILYNSRTFFEKMNDIGALRVWEPASTSRCSPINCHYLKNGQKSKNRANRDMP